MPKIHDIVRTAAMFEAYHEGIRLAALLLANTTMLRRLHVSPINAITGKHTTLVHHTRSISS